MQHEFQGKTAIVTGGANGIGLATARLLAKAGADVWVIDVEEQHPLEMAADFGAHGTVADVTNRESLQRAFAQAGEDVDVVVACAGVAHTASLDETKPSDWDRTIAVNLTGVFHTVQLAATRMIRR